LRPAVDVRPNKFVWLGCTVPYGAFTFLFQDTRFGLFRVHAYRYHEHGSTFIVQCRRPTWGAGGLGNADEDATLAILGEIFKAHLGEHKLVKNRSIWRNFPTVRCAKWHAGNVVLVGDAAHTAHFSIGSGTKLAMEDVIVLRDELLATKDTERALAAYEARRRPEGEALQPAAQASLEWFEGRERYMAMTPAQMTYSLMTRSLRVSHASVAKRDPELARGVEAMLAAQAGTATTRPIALPFTLGDRRARSRIAIANEVAAPTIASPGSAGARSDAQRGGEESDGTLVALGGAATTAGIVVTAVRPVADLATDDAAVAWKRIVEFVHGKGALIAARLVVGPELEAAVERAAFADFDLLVLVPRAGDDAAVEQLP